MGLPGAKAGGLRCLGMKAGVYNAHVTRESSLSVSSCSGCNASRLSSRYKYKPYVYNYVRYSAEDTGSIAFGIDAESRVRNAPYSVNWVILEKWRARAWISARFRVRRRSSPNFSTVKLPIPEP